MSDFDEEAERKRLREKYEREQEKREVTEKMSELLLQGATMTNAHCSNCGDPIFRYDGQEFCATCERPVDRDERSGEETGEGAKSEDTEVDPGSDDQIEVTSPSEDARVRFGGEGDVAGDQTGDAGDAGDVPAGPDNEASDPDFSAGVQSEPTSGSTAAGNTPSRARDPARPSGDADTAGGGASAARASLQRTLRRFAEQAEATEDPREAQAALAAAREAAEALAALRR